MQDLPAMKIPSMISQTAFVAIILFIAIAFVVGVWRGGPRGEHFQTSRRYGLLAIVGIIAWLVVGAIAPLSGVLEIAMVPPPALIFFVFCTVTAVGVALSGVGGRISTLPVTVLIGFQAFRLPLELVLHHWYESGTVPVQLTYDGHNFDIVTGVLAAVLGIYAWWSGDVSKKVVWAFNAIGFVLLVTVSTIAITSVPTPIRLYVEDPPVLLVYYFPYSWIVSIAISGALFGHVVLFRKLMWHNCQSLEHQTNSV